MFILQSMQVRSVIFANQNGPKIECGAMDSSHTQQMADWWRGWSGVMA